MNGSRALTSNPISDRWIKTELDQLLGPIPNDQIDTEVEIDLDDFFGETTVRYSVIPTPTTGDLAMVGDIRRMPLDQILHLTQRVDGPSCVRLYHSGDTVELFYSEGARVLARRGRQDGPLEPVAFRTALALVERWRDGSFTIMSRVVLPGGTA